MNKSYYAIIPANVRYDKRLTANAKLLFGEITALCNDKGYCWARNSYFAELYGVSKTSISKWISQLIEYGYIFSEIQYKEGTKEIENRYLKLVDNPINENVIPIKEKLKGYERKVNDPIEEKLNTPIEEKLKDNNTVINNTFNNKKVRKKEKEPEKKSFSFDEIINSYTDNEELRMELKEHLKTRKSKKATMTNRAIELSLNKLDKLSDSDEEKIQIVQNAIMSGWTTFYPLKNNDNKPTNSYQEQRVTINSKEYIMKNGKYYVPRGSGIPVNPYAVDDLPF